ncbi:MAG: hypothetical protein U0793_29525 [Gemmataceae bacterium]
MATRLLVSGACAFFMFAGALRADPPLRSGPQVGERNNRGGFCPNWITGPCAGKRLCPV